MDFAYEKMKSTDQTKEAATKMKEAFLSIRTAHPADDRIGGWIRHVQGASIHLSHILGLLCREPENMEELIRLESSRLFQELCPLFDAVPLSGKQWE